jgi:hypothetical protein
MGEIGAGGERPMEQEWETEARRRSVENRKRGPSHRLRRRWFGREVQKDTRDNRPIHAANNPRVCSCLSFVLASYGSWSKRRSVSQPWQPYIHAIGSPNKLTMEEKCTRVGSRTNSELPPITLRSTKTLHKKKVAESKPPKYRRVNTRLIHIRPQNCKKKDVC